MAAPEVVQASVGAHGSGWRVLPEAWVRRVSLFIRSAGTHEESRVEGRPELLYSRAYLPGQRSFYSSYNIRSRHFRCLESFFVEVDAEGELQAVVGLEGLRTHHRVLNVNLVVAQPSGQDPAQRLAGILQGVLEQAATFCDAQRLRFTYVIDTNSGDPLGIHITHALLDPPELLPFREEARIPNETGREREVVMLAFDRVSA